MSTLQINTLVLQPTLMTILEAHGLKLDLYVLSGTMGWLLDFDHGLSALAATTEGRVLKAQRRLTQAGLDRRTLLNLLERSGAIHIFPEHTTPPQSGTGALGVAVEVEGRDGIAPLPAGSSTSALAAPSLALPAVHVTPELAVPAYILDGLMAAGIEEDAISTLWFHPVSGVYYRQRIKSKFHVMLFLISVGRVRSATGFFISAVRQNFLLSRDYMPGKKKTPAPSRSALAQEAAGAEALEASASLQADLEAERVRLSRAPADVQWDACKVQLNLLLKSVLSAVEWSRLERLCQIGVMSARSLLDAALKARTGFTFEPWLQDLRLRLSGPPAAPLA